MDDERSADASRTRRVAGVTYFSGMMKRSRDHSSFREFCSGVPVIRSRWLDLNSIMVL